MGKLDPVSGTFTGESDVYALAGYLRGRVSDAMGIKNGNPHYILYRGDLGPFLLLKYVLRLFVVSDKAPCASTLEVGIRKWVEGRHPGFNLWAIFILREGGKFQVSTSGWYKGYLGEAPVSRSNRGNARVCCCCSSSFPLIELNLGAIRASRGLV